MSNRTPILADCKMGNICAPLPLNKSNGKKSVALFMDATSTSGANKIRFQLCENEFKPVLTKYGLDQVREDQNDPTRRGLVVIVDDPQQIAQLEAFDERIVQLGVEHSKEWFGKVLTEDQVRLRYKTCVSRASEEADYLFKFKVKCKGALYPTKILRKIGEKRAIASSEDDLANRHAKIVPSLSAYGIYPWAMRGSACLPGGGPR